MKNKNRLSLRVLILTSAISMLYSTVAFSESSIAQYEHAVDALKNNDHAKFNKIVEKMGDHPIAGYTQYQYLSGRLESEKTSTLEQFLEKYGYLKVSRDVRKELLSRAYKRNYWRDILDYYDPVGPGTTEKCEYLAAKLHEDSLSSEDQEVLESIWVRGESQPDACDDAFTQARTSYIDKPLIWRRIENAVREKNYKFAQYIGRTWLDGTDVTPLIDARKDPLAYLRTRIANPNSLRGQYALSLALEYLAVDEPDRAVTNFNSIRKNHNLKNEQIPYLLTRLCYRLSINHHKEAIEICDRVDNNYVVNFENESQWRVRAAIRQSDWNRIIEYRKGLSPSDQGDETWQYWYARALAATGNEAQGHEIFAQLSKERSLEGYLSADIIGAPYYINSKPTAERLKEIGYNPNELNGPLEIVKALVEIDQPLAAKEQLAYSVRRVDEISQLLLSQYASEQGWHLQAIMATSQAEYYDDLDIRFPLPHADTIRSYAKQRDVPDYWVAALIRQESIFTDDIKSTAGAVGLMQLMPATARHVAKKLNVNKPDTMDLIKADKNIQLGSWYIMDLWKKLGDRPRATASYNAGPNRAVSWTKRSDNLAMDQWIETIPFNETRGYVKRVMTYATIYANKFGHDDFNLTQFMDPRGDSPIRAFDVKLEQKVAFVPEDKRSEGDTSAVGETTAAPESMPKALEADKKEGPVKVANTPDEAKDNTDKVEATKSKDTSNTDSNVSVSESASEPALETSPKAAALKEEPSAEESNDDGLANTTPTEDGTKTDKEAIVAEPAKVEETIAKVPEKEEPVDADKVEPKKEEPKAKTVETKVTVPKIVKPAGVPKVTKSAPSRSGSPRKVVKPFGKPLQNEKGPTSSTSTPNSVIQY